LIQKLFNNRELIPYDDYINFALYDYEYGYYTNSNKKLGRAGDFYTSVHVHSVFAKKLSEYFKELINKHNLDPIIVEVGSGDGTFAKVVLENNPNIKYISIEKSNYHQQIQNEKLQNFSNFEVYSSFDDFKFKYGEFKGIIFSNELFDAMPIRVVERKGNSYLEVCINRALNEELLPASKEILNYIDKYEINLLDGFRTEIRINDINVLQDFVDCLHRGYIITIDYGYRNEELLHPARKNGSLRGYSKHQLVENILVNPGAIDITSHVNWDVLIREGENLGLETVGLSKQNEFLMSIGILDELIAHAALNPFSEESKLNRAIKSLVLDNGISQAFDVLVQKKN
jgi:SAM-dependent MidA family methyltransferase